MNSYFLKVWSIPIVLGVLTIIGLLAALIGSDSWHFVSWVFLSVPLFVMIKHILRTKGKNTK